MSKWKWTCGHTAEAMCQECYRQLAQRAHILAEENIKLKQEVENTKEMRRKFMVGDDHD